ncbi:trp operon leader peptide [Escherichia coli]
MKAIFVLKGLWRTS